MKRLRLYLDTSVFGGCFDEEFRKDSLRLMAAVHDGTFLALITDIVVEELAEAPKEVRSVLEELPSDVVERVEVTAETLALRDEYVHAGIVGRQHRADAAHVAAATMCRADSLVSWNFRHIVRLEKMRAYNQINVLQGYGILTILSPKEIVPDVHDEEQENV